MNKKRLLKLAELLEADAKNKKGVVFNLSGVISKTSGAPFRLNRGETPPMDCGTMACAIGLWGISGKFKGVTCSSDGWPVYENKTGITAAEKYFGLKYEESRMLFLPAFYTGLLHRQD